MLAINVQHVVEKPFFYRKLFRVDFSSLYIAYPALPAADFVLGGTNRLDSMSSIRWYQETRDNHA